MEIGTVFGSSCCSNMNMNENSCQICLSCFRRGKKRLNLQFQLGRWKRIEVWLSCRGRFVTHIHWRDPTTAHHGNFGLLSFLPGPFHSSLANLHPLDSSNGSMLMMSLARTPDQHARRRSSTPQLKSSTLSSFLEAGLQMIATHPAISHCPLTENQ